MYAKVDCTVSLTRFEGLVGVRASEDAPPESSPSSSLGFGEDGGTDVGGTAYPPGKAPLKKGMAPYAASNGCSNSSKH